MIVNLQIPKCEDTLKDMSQLNQIQRSDLIIIATLLIVAVKVQW